MKLIVGLGNIGKKYENTRHNAGFLAVDLLAEGLEASWTEDKKHNALIAKTSLHGETVLLAKPTTFMNLSGEAVQSLASYYKVDPKDILIVQDELDLAPGSLAFMSKGGDAGHNGISSIQERLGTNETARLRLGVGRPMGTMATEDWVLGKLDEATRKILPDARDAILDWIAHGLAKAMNTWNRSA
jgi:peptidyl-tRNA hydrolase, PTH1 family